MIFALAAGLTAVSVAFVGGVGFIGSHLVAQLAAQGKRIVIPTRRYIRARHLILLPTVSAIGMARGMVRAGSRTSSPIVATRA
mgnify:CR=1 FL=1